jgi:hypothetical protein
MTEQDIKNSIPPRVLALRAQGKLHKVAQLRTGIEDFGLDTAVGYIAKKAFYNRHVNKAIAASINAVDTLNK